MKKTIIYIKLIILLLLPWHAFSMGGTVYDQVCERIALWQNATGLNVETNVAGALPAPKVMGSYKISMIGEPEFHQELKLPMFSSKVKEKCKEAFISKVQDMPEKGMLEVVFMDALPQQRQASTIIHILFLEFY